jgi:hypothetical protein
MLTNLLIDEFQTLLKVGFYLSLMFSRIVYTRVPALN